jgi:hypothetical protein
VLGPFTDQATPRARAPRWRVSTLPVHGKSYSFAEPGIAGGPHGRTLIADAASANTGAPPTLWISRDGGRHWSVGRDFDTTGAGTGDVDGLVGPDGRLYALNLSYGNPPSQPANPAVLVFRSRDGRHWSGPASFPPPHGLDQPDRPWLVVNPREPANVDVVNSEGSGNIVMWRSMNHGASFAGPIRVTGGVNSQGALALSSRPLFDPTKASRLFMLYETAGSSEISTHRGPVYEFPLTQLWLATSTNAGRTWSQRRALNTSSLSGPLKDATIAHLLVASAIDRHGDLYAAMSLRRHGARRTAVYLMYSRTHGRSWSAPVRVGAPTASNVMPTLAVSPRGAAYLSWYGSANAYFGSSHAAWREMFARTPDPLARHPSFSVSQVSGRRPVHIGGIDTAGNLGNETGANWGLRDFQSIALGPCGAPELVWANDNGVKETQTATPVGACRRH